MKLAFTSTVVCQRFGQQYSYIWIPSPLLDFLLIESLFCRTDGAFPQELEILVADIKSLIFWKKHSSNGISANWFAWDSSNTRTLWKNANFESGPFLRSLKSYQLNSVSIYHSQRYVHFGQKAGSLQTFCSFFSTQKADFLIIPKLNPRLSWHVWLRFIFFLQSNMKISEGNNPLWEISDSA